MGLRMGRGPWSGVREDPSSISRPSRRFSIDLGGRAVSCDHITMTTSVLGSSNRHAIFKESRRKADWWLIGRRVRSRGCVA